MYACRRSCVGRSGAVLAKTPINSRHLRTTRSMSSLNVRCWSIITPGSFTLADGLITLPFWSVISRSIGSFLLGNFSNTVSISLQHWLWVHAHRRNFVSGQSSSLVCRELLVPYYRMLRGWYLKTSKICGRFLEILCQSFEKFAKLCVDFVANNWKSTKTRVCHVTSKIV